MDPAVLLIASAALPMLVFHAFWYREEKPLESIYGILSGMFAFFAAILVILGFPGSIILPGTFGIVALGALHAYHRQKERKKILRFLLLIGILVVLIIMEVLL